MAVLSCLLGGLAAAGVVAGAPAPNSAPLQLHRIAARAPAVALAQHTLPLTRRVNQAQAPNPLPRPFLRDQVRAALDVADDSGSTRADYGVAESGATSPDAGPVGITVGPATAASNDIEYIAAVQAGTNNLSLIVDTGSSDTWFVKDGFVCLDPAYRQPTLASVCQFGPAFKGDFPGGQITNQHFNVTYGSVNGPFLNGVMGYSDITVSSIVARKQQIGLATRGAWNGDGITSGILGLGLPGLTGAFTGTDAAADSLRTSIEYSPLVTTLAGQNVTQFSLALSRDAAESFLAFGGAPPQVAIDAAGWTSTKVLKLALRTGDPRYMYYQIAVEKMAWNSSLLNGSSSAPPDFIVDSGTTMNLFPYEIARSINSMFTPHAQYDPDQQTWFVRCDATAPSLGIQIAGRTLWTDPASMILSHVRDRATGLCASGIGVTSGFPYILGDVFMQQLVTVFDTATMEIKFAKRVPKPAAKTTKPAAHH